MLLKIYKSTQYSLKGLAACFKMEVSFRLEVLLCFFTLGLMFVLNIPLWQGGVLLICNLLILAIELLNSAIEKLADLVTTERNPLVAYAKDTGSAAVFLMHVVYIALFLFFITQK